MSDSDSDPPLGDSEGESGTETAQPKKRGRLQKMSLVDDEAELDSDEEASEDEDDGGPDQYDEEDGFLVNDLEVGEEDDARRKRGKSHRRKRPREDFELDEEDLDVMYEHFGYVREKRSEEASRLKRLKRVQDDELREDTPVRATEEERDALSDISDYDSDEMSSFLADGGGKRRRRRQRGRAQGQHADSLFQLFGAMDTPLASLQEVEAMSERRSKYDGYDPAELEAKYITEVDQEIKSKDVPERLQERIAERGEPPSEQVMESEAEWIVPKLSFLMWNEKKGKYERKRRTQVWGGHARYRPRYEQFATKTRPDDKDTAKKVVNVLRFIYHEHLDIPFIYHHRKDYILPELSMGELWEIFDLDEKWMRYNRRLERLEAACEVLDNIDFESMVPGCKTEEDLADLYSYLRVLEQAKKDRGESASDAMDEGGRRVGRRVPSSGEGFASARQSGIEELAAHFGMAAHPVAVNVMTDQKQNVPTDHERMPEELAGDYVTPQLPSAGLALGMARAMLAKELASHPYVRARVREMYMENCCLSTYPTKKGLDVIDQYHPYRHVKRLRKKPLNRFLDESFLCIVDAARRGLLRYEMQFDGEWHDHEWFPEIHQLCTSDGVGEVSAAWNLERRAVLVTALRSHLYPEMRREAERKLLVEAYERALRDYSTKLYSLAMTGPFRDIDVDPSHLRVMSCYWADAREPCVCSTVNPSGGEVDSLMLRNMNARTDPGASDVLRELKANDMKALEEFIISTRPLVIVVAAVSLTARKLFDNLNELLADIAQRWNYEKVPPVIYADCSVAEVRSAADLAKEEFPEFMPQRRTAISLARFLLDPLSEITALCNHSHDIRCLKLHPLQDLFPRELLDKAIRQVLVRVVNKVGCDINRARSHPHTSYSLQFIAGLGPRKRAQLLEYMPRTRAVRSREKIKKFFPATGDGERNESVVWTNCVSFLRISPEHFDGERSPKFLDNTRIHPADYHIVRQMVIAALDEQEETEATTQELVLRLRSSAKTLEALKQVDVEEFATDWERQTNEKKEEALYDMQDELRAPFKDPRKKPFQPPNILELFSLLTGETDQSLQDGIVVPVRVYRVDALKAMCRLDCGVIGMIRREDVADTMVESVGERIDPGMVVHAKVMQLDKEKFFAILSTKSSDLNHYEEVEMVHDEFLVPDAEEQKQQAERRAKKEARTASHVRRLIVHPSFRNVAYEQVKNLLRDVETGELLFSPGKDTSYIVLSFKFHNLIANVKVVEHDKVNDLSLGKRLEINGEFYDDLNEIAARFVAPIATLAQEMAEFRKFNDGDRSDVEKVLRAEKEANPKAFPYQICCSLNHPGRYLLLYLPNRTIRKEYVTVTPKGFRYRGREFPQPERLIAWFKRNWREPIKRRKQKPVAVEQPVPAANQQWPPASGASNTSSQWHEPGGGARGWGDGAGAGKPQWYKDQPAPVAQAPVQPQQWGGGGMGGAPRYEQPAPPRQQPRQDWGSAPRTHSSGGQWNGSSGGPGGGGGAGGAYGAPPPVAGRGRGRGLAMPAWMTSGGGGAVSGAGPGGPGERGWDGGGGAGGGRGWGGDEWQGGRRGADGRQDGAKQWGRGGPAQQPHQYDQRQHPPQHGGWGR